jgi:hypothetical protein
MSLMEDASRALAPHTRHLTDTLQYHGDRIYQQLSELNQESDVGRPDTGNAFKFIIVRKKLPAEAQPLNLITGLQNDEAGPSLGEWWLLQSLVTAGAVPKSPQYNIRTNTGRLIYASNAEANDNQKYGGDVVLLQGEIFVFEPAAEGVFDFTMSVVLRKMPRQQPDAGYGVSEEHYEDQSRTQEHERERDFPGHSYVPVEDYAGLTDPQGQLETHLP